MSQSDPSSEPFGRKAAERRLADLRASNERREKAMTAAGAAFGPDMTLRLQITSIHRVLAEADPDFDLKAQLAYQELLAEVFDQTEPEINKAKLLAGAAPAPTLLMPNGHRPS